MAESEKSNFIDYINTNKLEISSINIYLGTRNSDKIDNLDDFSEEEKKKQNKIKIFILKTVDSSDKKYFPNAKNHIIKEIKSLQIEI